MAEKSGAQTFERGLDLLWYFVERDDGHATIGDIVRTFDVSRSTAYRLVKILKDRQILEEAEAEGAYRLGIRVLQLANGVDRHRLLRQIMLPYMARLSRITEETVILTVKHGLHALCVERLRSQRSINFTFEKNRLMPLHAGASAKILLAYADPAEQEQVLEAPLHSYTPTTTTEPGALLKELRKIRAQGHVVTFSEIDPDSTSISVPILDRRGELVAGLSVGGPSFRMTEERIGFFLSEMKTVAAEVQSAFQRMNGGRADGSLPDLATSG